MQKYFNLEVRKFSEVFPVPPTILENKVVEDKNGHHNIHLDYVYVILKPLRRIYLLICKTKISPCPQKTISSKL